MPPPGDKYLQKWQKSREPFLALPPSSGGKEGCQLVGWRDPFVFEFKGQDGHEQWGMLMGSGIKTLGGAIMIYRSSSLSSGATRVPTPPKQTIKLYTMACLV